MPSNFYNVSKSIFKVIKEYVILPFFKCPRYGNAVKHVLMLASTMKIGISAMLTLFR